MNVFGKHKHITRDIMAEREKNEENYDTVNKREEKRKKSVQMNLIRICVVWFVFFSFISCWFIVSKALSR